MAISIPHVFVEGKKANADDWNENFAAIADKLNGGIGDDEVSSVNESKIVFGDAGHGHGGGSDGAPITLDEDQVEFNPVAGHTHDGSDSAPLALAEVKTGIYDGTQGSVKLLSGEVDVDNELVTDGGSSQEVVLSGLTTLLSLDVYWEDSGGVLTNFGIGLTGQELGDYGYNIDQISATGFFIHCYLKKYRPDSDTITFHWRAIGI